MLRVYAQSATASAPIIGASCAAPVADCPPLTRPHNLHYVECPPRKEALRGCRCAGSLIAITDGNNSGPQATLMSSNLSVFQPTEVVLCWPFERSTVLAASRACGEWPKTATLDAAALDAGRAWPTALAVSG
jgi:hypothetical protein